MRVEAANLLAQREDRSPVEKFAGDVDEYLDLRNDASLLVQIAAAKEYLPLGTFLTEIHGEQSIFSSVRAKTWVDQSWSK